MSQIVPTYAINTNLVASGVQHPIIPVGRLAVESSSPCWKNKIIVRGAELPFPQLRHQLRRQENCPVSSISFWGILDFINLESYLPDNPLNFHSTVFKINGVPMERCLFTKTQTCLCGKCQRQTIAPSYGHFCHTVIVRV